MERFIDKYIPIRVQQLIGDTLNSIGSRSQLQKLQNFEMEKYKKLNEEVLDDENNPELKQIMVHIAEQLNDTIKRFKQIAKQKGIRYKVSIRKEDTTTDGNSQETGQIIQDNSSVGSHSRSSRYQKMSLSHVGSNLKHKTKQRSLMQHSSSNHTNKDMSVKSSNLLNLQQSDEMLVIRDGEQIQSTDNNSKNDEDKELLEEEDPAEEDISPSPGLSPDINPDDSDEDEEEDAEAMEHHRRELLEWVVKADFSKEFSLAKITNHPFKLDQEEFAATMGNEGIYKICKVLLYKVGLTYKRMEVFRDELREEIKTSAAKSDESVKNDLEQINQLIQQVHDELGNHSQKMKEFKKVTLK